MKEKFDKFILDQSVHGIFLDFNWPFYFKSIHLDKECDETEKEGDRFFLCFIFIEFN